MTSYETLFFPDHALEIQHQLRFIALIAEQEARAKLHYSTKRNAERGFLFLRLRGPEIASIPATASPDAARSFALMGRSNRASDATNTRNHGWVIHGGF